MRVRAGCDGGIASMRVCAGLDSGIASMGVCVQDLTVALPA